MKLLMALLCCFPAIASAAYLGDPLGVVVASSGSVERDRAAVHVPVKAGTQIVRGDQITTAEDATARVIMVNKYVVTVRELSTVVFDDVAIDLPRGMIRVKYDHYKQAPLPIRTPYAIAAIRGSDGIFGLVGETLVVTGIDGQIDLCNEVIQRFDQAVATKTCQVTRRRMDVAEWGAYIEWSEQALRVSDLTWKSLLALPGSVVIPPPVGGVQVQINQLQSRQQSQHQHQSGGD